MSARMIKVSKVFLFLEELFFCVKSKRNKDWARLVPAAAVIPAVRVATAFIRFKEFVARPESFL